MTRLTPAAFLELERPCDTSLVGLDGAAFLLEDRFTGCGFGFVVEGSCLFCLILVSSRCFMVVGFADFNAVAVSSLSGRDRPLDVCRLGPFGETNRRIGGES